MSYTIPEYWDYKKVHSAFKNMSTVELYKFFGQNNATGFSNMMRKVFPDKPDRMSYSEYARSVLPNPNLDKSPPEAEVVEPRINTCPYEYDSPEWKSLDVETKVELAEKYPELKKAANKGAWLFDQK